MVGVILDAAARVLVERGYAATNTNLIAERAGVSVGSLYQYFPNKDALLAALYERHIRTMNEVVAKAFSVSDDLCFEEALHLVIEGLVQAHLVEAGLHRVLERQLSDRDVQKDHAEVERRISEQIRTLLQRYPDDVKVPNLELAIYMLMHALHPLVHEVVHQRPHGVSIKRATLEMVRFARLYLTAPA